jgi:hypothetical protein
VIGENRIERSVGTSIGEIAQKGIAGTQRKKAERNAIRPAFTRKNAVENFVDRAVAANRKEFSIALSVGLACKLHCVARRRRRDDIDTQSFLAQARDGWASEPGGFAAASSGINDGEETILRKAHGD